MWDAQHASNNAEVLIWSPKTKVWCLNSHHIIDFLNIRHINEIFCDDAEQICKVGHIHFFSMDIFNDAQRRRSSLLHILHIGDICADAVTSQARYSRVVHLHVSARYSRQSPMNRQTCSCAALCCAVLVLALVLLRALSVQHVPTSREESKIRTEKAILPTTGHTTALEEVVLSFETF